MSLVSVEAAKKMTKEQLLAIIEQQSANTAGGLLVKMTDKGGVFIRAESFKAYSTAKEKEYVSGVNMPASVAFALFLNPTLLDQVVKSVKALRDQAQA